MIDIKGVLLQWLTNFLIKKSSVKNKIISNKELAEEQHKPIALIFHRQYLGC